MISVNESSTHRPIRSFVRRKGRMTSSQKSALENLLPKYGVKYSLDLGLLPSSLLGNPELPLIIDIGFGDGELLVATAEEQKEINFIGIEVYDAGIGHCLKLIDEKKVNNLKLVSGDAVDVMKFGIVEKSINEINLFFPDPWPKKRHHKRRIINNGFIALMSEKLVNSGTVNISTDWEDYADQIGDLFSKRGEFLEKSSASRDISTKFERRGISLGHDIFNFTYELISQ
ncbi:MAG: tRNA (guanosine(46)-N7)-methyltransferase TrmB [Gammaproteobacteria bacterium]|nr:tRNA (guanosine(46)-N7)-methyltransferase TrmB [Gammaproteobacteria bacterium]OUT94008.1 MAG: tRNA (guanosine(46)-N7)-methyltransferase TrmB [Gammaproteobacteria bacterium TMED36]